MRALLVILLLAICCAPATATTYAIPNGDGTFTYLPPDTRQTFSIGALSFPPPWLASASQADRDARGILTVVETAPPDPALFTVGSGSIQIVAGVPTVVWNAAPLSPQQISTNAADVGYATRLAAGLIVVGSSSLNGTYALDQVAQNRLSAIIAGIAAGQGIPGGGVTFSHPDISGIPHSFNAAQITALAKAARDYLYALILAHAAAAAGQAPAWPNNQVTLP